MQSCVDSFPAFLDTLTDSQTPDTVANDLQRELSCRRSCGNLHALIAIYSRARTFQSSETKNTLFCPAIDFIGGSIDRGGMYLHSRTYSVHIDCDYRTQKR
uniref:Ribosomal RNA small subunit methyltransferase H n=1 Tax=Lygus hesperus TaxID=30085 RepID=A0A0A9ZAU1_LYGHE